MKRLFTCLLVSSLLLLSACSAVPATKSTYDTAQLRFFGERALEIEADFVQRFPYRSSGQPNNHLVAEWLQTEFTRLGLNCAMDEWEVVNFSKVLPLQNVVCRLPGKSTREVLLAAHLDQSPLTIQGADNDGSGIAIMIHLAEIFAMENPPAYTIVFLATDGEEWGQLGALRFVETHPNRKQIIAGISLDNLGNDFYDGLDIDARGQFRGYGPLWIQRMAQESARSAGDLWIPRIVGPVDQVLSQTVPLSFVDDGPMIGAGIPALNFGGHVSPEYATSYWECYHSPCDAIANQSSTSLYQAGRASEALVRQLLATQSFPVETGPYLYFADSQQVLRGLPLWSIFGAFVTLFFLGAVVIGRKQFSYGIARWQNSLFHFLSLWLPLLGSILLLYLFVATGLLDKYAVYFATTKDPAVTTPKWTAVALWVISLALLLWIGRRFAARAMKTDEAGSWGGRKSLSLFITGLGALTIAIKNPFSLLLIITLPFWFLISGRGKAWKILDVMLFLLGGTIVYVLFYFFGWQTLHINLYILWYILMMFSIQMIPFSSAVVITAILGAGLMLVVNPPRRKPASEPAAILKAKTGI